MSVCFCVGACALARAGVFAARARAAGHRQAARPAGHRLLAARSLTHKLSISHMRSHLSDAQPDTLAHVLDTASPAPSRTLKAEARLVDAVLRQVTCFKTSIWDETLYRAWSQARSLDGRGSQLKRRGALTLAHTCRWAV
eukprot:6187528-Pleurochrysis_carterae.AAC.3